MSRTFQGAWSLEIEGTARSAKHHGGCGGRDFCYTKAVCFLGYTSNRGI
jgi:hypothetical protein